MRRAWLAVCFCVFGCSTQGDQGPNGPNGEPGATGAMGATGTMGTMGTMGTAGQSVATSVEAPGAHCTYGGAMLVAASGTTYVCNGAPAVTAYGYFFAQMPADNAATVAPGGSVEFPQDGPLDGITRATASAFTLPAVGVYEVSWQVSVNEAGQLVLALDSGAGFVDVANTLVGRATGTTQLVGHALVKTTAASSKVTLRNPAGNPSALTITPLAGGAATVTAGLVIKRIS